MILVSHWNRKPTFEFQIEREFGTDYGMCCWYTPQLNITEIDLETKAKGLEEPYWGEWFMKIKKVPDILYR